MKYLLLALALLTFNVRADEWTSGDKRAHFASGTVLSLGTTLYTKSAGAGFTVGCGIGIAGELVDASRYGVHSKHVSIKDATMQCLGAAVGAQTGVWISPSSITWRIQF
jgi:hypothetical protein